MTKSAKIIKSDFSADATLFSDYDIHLFREGKHFHLYKKLGSRLIEYQGNKGTYFALWAPNAQQVSVIGDFNAWDRHSHNMKARGDGSGIWELFIPDVLSGTVYKYYIRSNNGYEVEKGDPYALYWENPPETASIVWEGNFQWNDEKWMAKRKEAAGKPKPYALYEMHIGSVSY